MSARAAERRRSTRTPAVYFTVLRDGRNRKELASGRTANTSETGVMVLVRSNDKIPIDGKVCATLTLPADPAAGTKRQVVYECRIVRRLEMGNMLGLGLEFLTKLA
ncbi:MAG: PilZ domain-containing protein [Planctomycetes bacterium]|nr:PilZ domain-containing protein [Planctomycetota bacterium]